LSLNDRATVHRHGIAYVHVDCDRDGGARQDTEELPAAVIIDTMRAER